MKQKNLLKTLFAGFIMSVSVPLTVNAQDIEINEENFPDENFRNYLLEQEYGEDRIITEEEIQSIYRINVDNKNIVSLEGIEHFTALERLDCNRNLLRELDVSKNTVLTYLYCGYNQLTTLDVSKNIELKHLSCSVNQLISLDVSKNTKLINLVCGENQLTSLTGLVSISLKTLDCHLNQLTSLDLSNCVDLTDLYGRYNQLNSLDVRNNVKLTVLECNGNQLTSLDLSNNSALYSLKCSANQLTSLDLSNNAALSSLSCGVNQLTSLDVSVNTLLVYLECSNNKLTSLDISNNTLLRELDCSVNQLISLAVSNQTALTSLRCSQNNIKERAMYALVKSLPIHETGIHTICVYDDDIYSVKDNKDGNVCTKSQVREATKKGWTVQKYWDKNYEGVLGSDNSDITNVGYTAYVTWFDVDFTKTPGLTAYKVNLNLFPLYVKLEQIDNAPMGTAVVLHGESGDYTLYEHEDEVDEITDNLFMASENTVGDGSTIYALGNKNDEVGFYLVKDGISVPEDKGYLEIEPTVSNARAYISFGGGETGIETITEDKENSEGVVFYNLAGQRVSQPVQGGIYIVNGKKVVKNK